MMLLITSGLCTLLGVVVYTLSKKVICLQRQLKETKKDLHYWRHTIYEEGNAHTEADWGETDELHPNFIKSKPIIPSME